MCNTWLEFENSAWCHVVRVQRGSCRLSSCDPAVWHIPPNMWRCDTDCLNVDVTLVTQKAFYFYKPQISSADHRFDSVLFYKRLPRSGPRSTEIPAALISSLWHFTVILTDDDEASIWQHCVSIITACLTLLSHTLSLKGTDGPDRERK